MKVLFAASECTPFVKTGGLADVVGALPYALAPLLKGKSKESHSIVIVLPKYSAIDDKLFQMRLLPGKILIPVGDSIEEGFVWELVSSSHPFLMAPKKIVKERHSSKVSIYFIENKGYFGRDGIYQGDGQDFLDNDERYIFFSRAVLEFCKLIDFVPDVIHCHDWQTGLIPTYLKTLYRTDAFFNHTASVFSIHNIVYQGVFPKETLFLSGFGWHDFVPDKLEYYNQFSFLKAALVYADKISTVSPTYAKEIQQDNKHGHGMEGVLKSRSKDFIGILNGVDPLEWDPAKDPTLIAQFSPRLKNLIEKKSICKNDLQKNRGLLIQSSLPLIGMVSRLDPQKGHFRLAELVPQLVENKIEAQWVILGSGHHDIEQLLTQLTQQFSQQFSFCTDFNNVLAHKIYAGSDLFFMPSEFEPCGLSQMIAMRYGSIPIVTPTGGLLDTVIPWSLDKGKATGFISSDISTPALFESIKKAVELYQDKIEWETFVRSAMAQNFSWKSSAQEYIELYKSAIKKINF